MKKIMLIAMALAAVAGVWWWQQRESDEAPAYREVRPERGDLRVTILATGTVQPQNRVELNSPVAGRVEKILVDEGDTVTNGQMLAQISSAERAALLDAARARGPSELARWEELYKATPLIAPLDGTIIARPMEPGQSTSLDRAILVMSDRLIVSAQVDETDIARIALNQPAEVVLDAYPGRTLAAHVEHIAYEAELVENVTVYNIDVLPDEIPEFLRSGMTANITFIGAAATNALLLPMSAVVEAQGSNFVLQAAAAPDQEPRRVEVKLGLSDGKRAVVLAGLADGDVVLEKNLQFRGPEEGAKGNPLVPFGRWSSKKRK